MRADLSVPLLWSHIMTGTLRAVQILPPSRREPGQHTGHQVQPPKGHGSSHVPAARLPACLRFAADQVSFDGGLGLPEATQGDRVVCL